jgi:hypothetical protein
MLDMGTDQVHTPDMEQLQAPEYLSYSQFTTYLQCSEKFRLTRMLKLEEDPAWYFAGGTAVHAAADAIDYALLEGK